MRIEVLIDELVLHGVDPSWRHAVGDAFEVELMRAMRTPELHVRAGFHHVARIDAGAVHGRDASSLGGSIAGAVQGAITAALAGGGRAER